MFFFQPTSSNRFAVNRARSKCLNKYQVLRGDDEFVVEEKALAKMRAWDETWSKKVATEERQANIADKKFHAERKTPDASQTLAGSLSDFRV